jgi:L,D-peptidoglycan transpeptidase YkuD (ErfK/YbiS/YcfS/YnhG family)
VPVAGPWGAVIGAAGFSDHHMEGDNTTPTGYYGIGPVMYGNQPNPGVQEQYVQLTCGDWWDEDPTTTNYNTFQVVPCGQAPPFGGGSEALWTETAAYPSFAVVDYNTDPVIAYRGSAIFIHAEIGVPTAGCVSLPLADLDQYLRWVDPADDPAIVMGPSSEITTF